MTPLMVATCSSSLILGGCSSSSSDVNTVSPEFNNPEVQGYAVKGLLQNADVTLFSIDLNHPQLKGDVLDTGSTDNTGAITGLTLPESLQQGPFLIEVTNGQELDGSTPVIPTLRSIVRANQLVGEFQTPITVTPITTMILDLTRIAIAKKNDPSSPGFNPASVVTLENLYPVDGSGEINQQATQLKAYFGLGLLNDINLFTTQPTLTEDGEAGDALAYRTVIEVTAALVNQVQTTIGGSDANSLLTAIVQDMSDGEVDGFFAGQAISAYNSQPIATIVGILSQSTTQLMSLTIPGTDGTPISQLNTVLAEQANLTGGNANDAPDTVTIRRPTTLGPDSDGDGVIDQVDVFPSDPDEQYDSDMDGVGDNADFAPNDPDVQTACDSAFDENFPNRPIADAGNDKDEFAPAYSSDRTISLNGSSSCDPNGDTITYSWRVIEVPQTPGGVDLLGRDGSNTLITRDNLLENPTTATPSFEMNFAGTYVFELTVSDGSESSTDTVNLTFNKPYYIDIDGGFLFTTAVTTLLLFALPARRRQLKKQ